MWFGEIINLGSRVNGSGTTTDLGIWFKSSKVRESKLVQELGLNKKVESLVHIHFPSMAINEMWLCKISDSSSRFIGMKIKIDLEMCFKSEKNTGVTIDSKIGIESLNWGSCSHSCSSSVLLKG